MSALWSIIHIWRLAPPIAARDLPSMRSGKKRIKKEKAKRKKTNKNNPDSALWSFNFVMFGIREHQGQCAIQCI